MQTLPVAGGPTKCTCMLLRTFPSKIKVNAFGEGDRRSVSSISCWSMFVSLSGITIEFFLNVFFEHVFYLGRPAFFVLRRLQTFLVAIVLRSGVLETLCVGKSLPRGA